MESSSMIERARAERIHNERLASPDVNRRGKQRIGRHGHFDDEYMSDSRNPVHYRNYVSSHDLNVDHPEYATHRPQFNSLRPRSGIDQWGPNTNMSHVSYMPRTQGRYEYDSFDEGPSSYEMDPYYAHGGRKRYQNHNLNGIASIETLENGRAELLRKLDELKDQLSKSCELAEKPDLYGRNHAAYVQEGLTRPYGHSKHPLSHNEFGAQYLSQSPEVSPYRDSYERHMPEPKRGYPHELLDYVDRPNMLRGTSHELGSNYMHGPYHERYPGYYENAIHDDVMLRRHENHFHQPGYMDLPPKADPFFSHDRRPRNEPSHSDFQYNLNPALHGPQSYSSGSSKLHPVRSRESITMHSSDQDSDKDGFDFHDSAKVVVPDKNKKVRYPIAGGAPFVTCSSCFELLKLPRKRILLAKSKLKLKCGACSSTVLFEFGNSVYVVSDPVRVEEVTTDIGDKSSETDSENADDYEDRKPILTPIEKHLNSGGDPERQMDPVSANASILEKEENPFKAPSQQNDSPTTALGSVQVKSFSNNDDSPSEECHDQYSDNIMATRYENRSNKSFEQEKVCIASRQSSMEDGTVATEMDVSLNGFPNSSVSQDSVEISKEEIPRNVEISKEEIPRNVETSKEEIPRNVEISKEKIPRNVEIRKEEIPRNVEIRKEEIPRGDPFRPGVMKNSLKDHIDNDNEEDDESQVYVNGRSIPDFVVKKAEDLAGPIQPGDYWYDIRAGFWGVMGYPCLGIIMPNIEEFNYPIPEKCADGNTRVYVNGRELHQKDLDLLASRGLPIIAHRSYSVDMSGKVVDDQTGEELDSLGKLAPTVEKAKHGFGMRVPKFISRARN